MGRVAPPFYILVYVDLPSNVGLTGNPISIGYFLMIIIEIKSRYYWNVDYIRRDEISSTPYWSRQKRKIGTDKKKDYFWIQQVCYINKICIKISQNYLILLRPNR